MAITPVGGKNYVVPKGRLYFDRYPQGITIEEDTPGEGGERYLGNTPGFTINATSENLDHFSSEGGVNVKDASVQLSLNRAGSLTTDDISAENLSLALLGDESVLSVVGATGLTSIIANAVQGRHYQIGVSTSNPAGLRDISNVVVKSGSPGFAVTVAMSGNYEVDLDLGRIYILDGAPGIDGIPIQVEYDQVAHTRTQIISGTESIYGALRLIADNPIGDNKDWYFPYVKLALDGDMALKGEEWQQIAFTIEVLQKGSLASVYVDGRPS
jgi:hypothetical protein